MVCSAIKIVYHVNFHTSSSENLEAFTDEETEAKESMELAKVLQTVCKEAGTGAPVLDSKPGPLYIINPVLCAAPHEVLVLSKEP